MRKNVFYYLSAFLLVFTVGCSEMADVEPVVDQTETLAAEAEANEENLRKKQRDNVLANMIVEGVVTNGDIVSDENFIVTITSFSYDEVKGLLASGTIQQVSNSEISGTFEDVEATLSEEGGMVNGRTERRCQVLFLDLGPIFLDVLGLQVDLSQIVLDITAVSGTGNLLGNLLCALVGLFDPLTGLTDALDAVTNLIDRINNLLG